MVQVNAPYAATPVLAGFLKSNGFDVSQVDASLELALALFSARGVESIRTAIKRRFRKRKRQPAAVAHFLAHAATFRDTVDPVIRFLQGHDPSLALRIAGRDFLPEGPRFAGLGRPGSTTATAGMPDESLAWAFGALGTHDKAVHLASLYLDDLVDAIREGVDKRFDLARYGESLAAGAPTFDGLARALGRQPTLVDGLIDAFAEKALRAHGPDVVGFTLPFPGTVYGAFRMARRIKALQPHTTVVLGGGYASTELRGLRDPRVFDSVDFVVLDDGEQPFLRLLAHLQARALPLLQLMENAPPGRVVETGLVRTFFRAGGRVVFAAGPAEAVAPPCDDAGAPDFSGLPLDRYFAMAEMLNPMHRIWSSVRWNKLMLAHGCYWHQCRFCDTHLGYIRQYRATPAAMLADRIETVIAQTGQTGFHFIDEAAPPAVLRHLAEELIRRRLAITWWGNIRFEAAFTPELTELLARSGCVAVTGGLEAAHDRLLQVLDKGLTVEQAGHAARAFAEAGIMVHAYLMYGCPTQTEQETVDALETVRQFFAAGWLQSAYWHRFALTVHSDFFRHARDYGLRVEARPPASFALNEVPFRDGVEADHVMLGRGLRKAVYNYMHGVGLDADVRDWFDRPAPPAGLA